jgi:23S rRNA (cytidine1920-2'-O)/16S rRNA (cytidine1409-2'-O)-methyltransferase
MMRLDEYLIRSGEVESRKKAQALILAGNVWVDGSPRTKCGDRVRSGEAVVVRAKPHPYVSRGGVKLEYALKYFSISTVDKIALDVGSSTGGFTHCLLLNGMRKVYAVDVGKGQMDWRLRGDPRVELLEGINARYLTLDRIGGERVDFFAVDVSFISLRLILPVLVPVCLPGSMGITLVKPQFEVGRGQVPRGGVVKDERLHQRVVEELVRFGENLGFKSRGAVESPIHGAAGNKEFLCCWER